MSKRQNRYFSLVGNWVIGDVRHILIFNILPQTAVKFVISVRFLITASESFLYLLSSVPGLPPY
jgi:hypothetical protein